MEPKSVNKLAQCLIVWFIPLLGVIVIYSINESFNDPIKPSYKSFGGGASKNLWDTRDGSFRVSSQSPEKGTGWKALATLRPPVRKALYQNDYCAIWEVLAVNQLKVLYEKCSGIVNLSA